MSKRQRTRSDHRVLALAALLLATLVVYHPALHGGLLWDDGGHVTKSGLRSIDGLRRIWFELGATQQYYPVVHSAFWLQHRLWGDHTLGYHAANVLLHGTSAFLLVLILRRLAIPGAVLAGIIFALHPVYAESVAWITELKNTLSGVFYFAAALAYLHFDEKRTPKLYALSFALFLCALLSKTVTATLPIGLLIVFWWQRGRLSWRRDVVPLVPFVAIGAAAGLLTAWVERTFIGAEGADFQLTVIERVLVAGRAVWFYLATVFWPVNLTFVYPRWQINHSVWWQYLYPLAGVALAAVLWAWRERTRAPLAAFLFFVATLGPALGFVDVYPFRYSFVADHFQYLASVGIVVLVAAALTTLATETAGARTPVTALLIIGIGVPLGVLTRRQSQQYVDAKTLYRTTIARNPAAWLAHNNLAVELLEGTPADVQEAVDHAREAVRLNPQYPQAHYNIGVGLAKLGRDQDAIAEFQIALAQLGAVSEGSTRAADVRDQLAGAHYNLGVALEQRRQLEAAVVQFREAVRINPRLGQAHRHLAVDLHELGRPAEAIPNYQSAIALEPSSAELHNDLGIALFETGRKADAIAAFQEALRLKPDFARARANLERAR